jgi:predicted nucleic-acid-binding protein
MRIVDANVILRYLLNDLPGQSATAAKIIEENAFFPYEVIAEVVYVLEKTYCVNRAEIYTTLTRLVNLPSVEVNDLSVILIALELFTFKKIDFVDALLAGYSTQSGVEIATFDKKLLKVIASLN